MLIAREKKGGYSEVNEASQINTPEEMSSQTYVLRPICKPKKVKVKTVFFVHNAGASI